MGFRFFSKLDTFPSKVLPMGVLKHFFFSVRQPPKNYSPFEVLIPIGWCEFPPAWQNMKLKGHA